MAPRLLLRRVTTSSTTSHIFKRSISSSKDIVLHHEWIGPAEVSTSEPGQVTVVFLHGLLGNGKNLRTFANRVLQVRNESTNNARGLLLDLRGHGKSGSGSSPHNFESCVRDVHATLQHAGVNESAPTTLVGHSWGGRVALQYAHDISDCRNIAQTWLLDTVPGQAHSSVQMVLQAILSLPQDELSDRKVVVKKLVDHGLDMSLAQWLAASVVNDRWGFDVDVVREMLPEFGTQDFIGMLDRLQERASHVHLVRGGKNPGWKESNVLATLEDMTSDMFRLHTLPEAGHWVHVDDLKGLVGLFEKHAA